MSVFAPFPLALSIIMYGRVKGYLIGLLGLAVCTLFAIQFYQDVTLAGFYFIILLFSIGISEIVFRGFQPVKGMVIFGLSFILLVAGGFFQLMNVMKTTPKEFIMRELEKSADKLALQKKLVEQSNDKESIEVLQILDKPELMANGMIESFPSYFFMGIFIMLWFNMFLVLKSRRLLFSGNDYPYSEKNLLNFKVPFGFILLFVVGLVLAIWGKDIGAVAYETLGFTIIKCLGIFYFFQGFGVFSDLLNFLGVVGFFRTLIVMLTIFTANYLIAAAGLFDNWFDFRKYFVKTKTED